MFVTTIPTDPARRRWAAIQYRHVATGVQKPAVGCANATVAPDLGELRRTCDLPLISPPGIPVCELCCSGQVSMCPRALASRCRCPTSQQQHAGWERHDQCRSSWRRLSHPSETLICGQREMQFRYTCWTKQVDSPSSISDTSLPVILHPLRRPPRIPCGSQ